MRARRRSASRACRSRRAGTNGETVTMPLGQVATIEASMGPAQIDREDLERVVTIFANVAPGSNLGDITKGIQQGIASIDLPAGYTIGLGGDSEEMAETSGYVAQSVMLAVILIYLILASQFGSFTQPFSIMFALPLSLVGVMLALLATGDTLNLMSMIGVLLLMGLVTKNAILLVDNANQQRREGKSMVDALVEAGVTRLRPIVMTTLAMIVGMIPIALGTGEGGELRAPMARAVIGGLLTSTLLTLDRRAGGVRVSGRGGGMAEGLARSPGFGSRRGGACRLTTSRIHDEQFSADPADRTDLADPFDPLKSAETLRRRWPPHR